MRWRVVWSMAVAVWGGGIVVVGRGRGFMGIMSWKGVGVKWDMFWGSVGSVGVHNWGRRMRMAVGGGRC